MPFFAPEPFFSRGPSTCPSAWFSLSAGSNPWTSKNENHHTGVKHRLKKRTQKWNARLRTPVNFFSAKKKGWLTGRRRGCCVGLFVAAASVCRLCGLVRSVGFKKIFNHFFLLFLKSPITVTVASNKQGSGGYKTIVYLFKYCSNAIRLYRRCRK